MFEFFGGVFATLAAFFLVGEMGFWLLLGGSFCCVWYSVSRSRGLGALALVVGTGLIVQFVSKLDIAAWAAANWRYALAWSAAYVLIGGVYALFRWQLFCSRKSRELGELESTFRKREGVSGAFSLIQKRDFYAFLSKSRYRTDIEDGQHFDKDVLLDYGVVPTAARNKYAIGRFVWWWPVSALGWFLDDFIRELYELVSRGLSGLMDYMARRVFGDQAALSMTRDELREAEREAEREADAKRSPHTSSK